MCSLLEMLWLEEKMTDDLDNEFFPPNLKGVSKTWQKRTKVIWVMDGVEVEAEACS